ncbi:hypothetical protein BZA70DRAFT_282007 [Myxozyma melibiosi]|uniref:Uncharacterized protein n=1 Tax=Myxozyma melibiosi TaxID=54550 RepID=A0ABR1F1P0_9ASCO
MSTASARQQHSRQPSTDSVATTVSTSSTSSKTHRRNASSSTVSDYERKKALKNLETSPTDQDRLGPRFANDDKETKKKSRFKKMLSFIAPQQQSSTTAPVYGPPTPVSYIVTSTSTSPVSTKSMNSSIPAPSRTSSHDSRRSSRAVDSVDVMEYNFLNESIYKKQATAGSQQEAEDDDDNTSIRSTASSVSKALRRFSTGLSSRRPSKVSSMSSLNNGSSSNSSSTASSVRDSVVIADEGEDDDDASQYETVRMYEPVKNPAVIPKSILKSMCVCLFRFGMRC